MTQPVPTQTRHPGRATFRTIVAVALGLIPLLPAIIDELGLSSVGWIAGALAIAATVTRVLAMPSVNKLVTEYLPWLAPAPRQP